MGIRRRVFLAGLGGAGVGFGLGGVSHLFPLASPQVGPGWSPGSEEFVPSTCTLCPSHCGILVRIVDGAAVAIRGNPLHPISRGGLCPKGQAGLQLLNHPTRFRGPLERTGPPGSDGFDPISWDAALERVAKTLGSLRREGRAESVGWLVGDLHGSTNELLERFLRVYGSPHLARQSYRDGSEEVLRLTQGIETAPAFDLDRADLVVSFGAPLSEAWRCLPQAARARGLPEGRKRRWVQIDTRLSRTAVTADLWLAIRPGGYGALALSIAYVLLKEGLYDSRWISDGVTGFEDWTDAQGRLVPGYRTLVLRHGRPEAIARRTGLEVRKIVRLAKEFGRASRPLAVWDNVVGWSRTGLADALAIHALNVIAGSLQRPGGIFVQPPLPVPSLEESAPLPSGSAESPGRTLGGADWADRVLDPDGPPIQVLFLYHANPVASAPDPEKIRRALERIPLVISFSPFPDESSRHAHLVLPDHTYLERWQDAPAPSTVPYPVWGVVQPVVPPLHDTRATADVLLQLASLIGDDLPAAFPWSSMEELVRERGEALTAARRGSAFVSAFRLDELREMEARGWWIPHGQTAGQFWKHLRESGGWFDPYHDDQGRAGASRRPDGRVSLFPEEARQRIAGALPGLVEGFLPLGEASEKGRNRSATDAYPLMLQPYRVMTLAAGGLPLMPWLLENVGVQTGNAWEVWAEIHPDTARELKLDSGRRVRIVSKHGAFTARLSCFEGAQPGVVNVPYGLHSAAGGWGGLESANPLVAVGDARDPVTGLPDWSTTRVRVESI